MQIGDLHGQVAAATSTNEDLYNGKELTSEHDLNWYHYGARFYDVARAQWTTMDPADQFHSPYTYVGGDPVNLIDPDGRQATGITAAIERDNRAVLSGEMSYAEHRARREARAQGLRMGVEVLADTAVDLFELITGYTVTLDEGNRGAAAAALGLPGVSSRALKSLTQVLENVRVKSFGEVVYEGTVDLKPTIRRIDAGE